MSFHSIVCCRASQVEKVVCRAKVELKRRVPVSGQLGLRCFDIYGLKIVLRSQSIPSFFTAEPLDPFLRSFSCSGMKRDKDGVMVISTSDQGGVVSVRVNFQVRS